MKTYNKKAFLLPDSINSCALYHAKVFEDGKYIFRIHDCLTGIRFTGDLNTPESISEAYNKVIALIEGLDGFKDFIFEFIDRKKELRIENVEQLKNPNDFYLDFGDFAKKNELSKRLQNVVKHAGWNSVAEILKALKKDPYAFIKLKNVGIKSAVELEFVLSDYGIEIRLRR